MPNGPRTDRTRIHAGTDLYLANSDGTSSHLLVSARGPVFAMSFSPDGSRIRFSVQDQLNSQILTMGGSRGRNQSASIAGRLAYPAH